MAAITAAAGGGNFSANGTWVGGVAPTAADDALLTGTSGAVTVDAGSVCRSCDCTGYTGTLTHTAGVVWTIGDATAGAGNSALKLVSGMTYTLGNATTSSISFVSTNAIQQTITTNGKSLGNVTFNGLGGSWIFSDAVAQGAAATITLTNGSFAAASNVTTGSFSSQNTNVRSLNAGPGTWTLAKTGTVTVWDVNPTNLTFVGEKAAFVITGADALAKSFTGNGHAFGSITYTTAAAGSLFLSAGASLGVLDVEVNTLARGFYVDGTFTVTVSGVCTLKGQSGQLLTIDSIDGVTQAIIKAGSFVIAGFESVTANVLLVGLNSSKIV